MQLQAYYSEQEGKESHELGGREGGKSKPGRGQLAATFGVSLW